MKTRYMKVVRDLSSDYVKNFMLVIALTIGIFGIGSILGGYGVIKREMSANYLGTVPASATIEMEQNISQWLIDSVRNFPGIKVAERHATVLARMKVEEKWYPILLFIIDDFKQKKTNKVYHVSGVAEPSIGTMLVERSAFVVMQAKEGDEILVKTPSGKPQKIKISGTVHDPGLAPAWQEQAGYGYITLSTLHLLGETQGFNQLRILVSEQPYSRQHITDTSQSFARQLEKMGYHIHEIQVPSPGKHPHQSQMSGVMSIFTVFSFFILALGSILVATSMAMLMVKQTRQIGVMKTIGAKSLQVAGLYIVMIVILCFIALTIAVPLSRIAAAAFYNQIAALLNLEIHNSSIPYWVPLLQVASGIIIPFIAALIPVYRASRITVRKALDNYGVSLKSHVNNLVAVWISKINLASDTFSLSIRNVLRLRSKLILTLGLLAAGGGMFMTALNVSEAWKHNLKKIYVQHLYDVEVRLNNSSHADTILNQIRAIEGVSHAEGWSYSSTSLKKASSFDVTQTYPDKGHGSFTMLALPVPTRLLNLNVVEGKWLSNSKSNDVVLNQIARNLCPGVAIGHQIILSVDGKPSVWKVIGFTQDMGSPATAYVSIEVFTKLLNLPGQINMLRVALADRSKENTVLKNREVDILLQKQNISVSASFPVWQLRNVVAAHMRVLVNSLMAMAILMALVGTIGLMSTMSMSILERTREIGVMRAIGATPKKIKNLLLAEGLIIGVLSVFIAFGLSIIMSSQMSSFIGDIAFKTPLELTISIVGIIVWILIIVLGSYAATLYPARRAGKISTREALAYE